MMKDIDMYRATTKYLEPHIVLERKNISWFASYYEGGRNVSFVKSLFIWSAYKNALKKINRWRNN